MYPYRYSFRRRRYNPYNYRYNPWRSRGWQRNPVRRWARPLSAKLAREYLDEPFEEFIYESDPEIHSILVIGGDRTYIPDWMDIFDVMQIAQIGVDLDQQLGDFEPDLVLFFVKADQPYRPTKHTVYKAKNYCRGDNRYGITIPYITIHKGWGHVMQRASELGLDWFVDAYPHPIYVPPEDLQPRKKRPMTKGRLTYALKRAERLREAGITAKDIVYAHSRYVLEDPSQCVLCDTKIKYQFRLLFDLPGQHEPVNFYPVGSTCIIDWVEALPDSEGKIVFLEDLDEELKKVEAIKKSRKARAYERQKQRRQEQSARRKQANQERLQRLAKIKQSRRDQKQHRRSQRKTLKRKMDDLQQDFGF